MMDMDDRLHVDGGSGSRGFGRFGWMLASAILIALGGQATTLAHDFKLTEVLVVLKNNRTFQMDMIVDLDALALGVPATTDSSETYAALQSLPPEALEEAVRVTQRTLLNRVHVRWDGQPAEMTVEFPEHRRGKSDSTAPSMLGTLARFSGSIPPDGKEFVFSASKSFPAVQLTILDESIVGGIRLPLGTAEDSPPYRMGEAAAAGPPSDRVTLAGRYLILGFTHILPKGLDHILFVLSLFLLSTDLRSLLWQVTAFTVAHSITLALSMYGVFSLPSSIVEPLIAASIAYVAVENLVTGRLHFWRPMLVFGFGLLHGLGFAGVLRELGLPRSEFLTALLAFNGGVELGQLAVVLGAFALVGWFRKRSEYRAMVVVPVSMIIALVGIYWSIERAAGGWFGPAGV